MARKQKRDRGVTMAMSILDYQTPELLEAYKIMKNQQPSSRLLLLNSWIVYNNTAVGKKMTTGIIFCSSEMTFPLVLLCVLLLFWCCLAVSSIDGAAGVVWGL